MKNKAGKSPFDTIGDSTAHCPPLVITEEELNELFDRLERALNRALDWAAGAGR
ncbi:MAG: hypothetical protein AAFX09_03895 [Pseudomonadota bacterium]